MCLISTKNHDRFAKLLSIETLKRLDAFLKISNRGQRTLKKKKSKLSKYRIKLLVRNAYTLLLEKKEKIESMLKVLKEIC